MTHTAVFMSLLLILVEGGTEGAFRRAEGRMSDSPHVSPDRIVFMQVPAWLTDWSAQTGWSARTGDAIRAEDSVGADARLPQGSRVGTFNPASPGDGVKNLTPGFAAAGFPDVSFDGKRILFVGRKTATGPFHVWEMNADGSGLRRITCTDGPPVAACPAIYLSTIYTMDAEAPVYQIAFSTDEDGGALYTCRLDGTRTRRITYNPYGVGDPFLLSDGRLLFRSGSPRPAVSHRPAGPHTGFSGTGGDRTATGGGWGLFTINTDGTEVFIFAGLGEPALRRRMPCETPNGRVVYVESGLDGPDARGSLVSVARTRSLHTRRVVADDPVGSYHSPSAAGDGRLLVSYRAGLDDSYGIHLLDLETGQRVAELFDDPVFHDVDAVAVRPRITPKGRSSVVPASRSVDERMDRGWLYGMDAYVTDRQPTGRREPSERIEPGRIKRLRVIAAVEREASGITSSSQPAQPEGRDRQQLASHQQAGLPVAGGLPAVPENVLGEVVVESDGSFYVEVPARMPLRLETLDENGEVLQRMHHWIWVMPREARGCIGCHEDRELTPPNRHTLALRKAATVLGVSSGRPLAPAGSPHTESDDSR